MQPNSSVTPNRTSCISCKGLPESRPKQSSRKTNRAPCTTPQLSLIHIFALRHICLVEDKKIFAFKISVGSLAKLAIAAEQYALTHLDKPLKSYDFLKSVLP